MNAKRMILINIILLVILVGGGFAGYYYYNQSVTYLSTDNAQVAGQQVNIAAPANGTLTSWKGETGQVFSKNDKLGSIEMVTDKGKTSLDIKAPAAGTVVQSTAVKNATVAAGTPLAVMYDLDQLWVTANVDETEINDVKVGQDVDIYVDAYPNMTLSGKVEEIGLATAGTFSLLPKDNASGNYTKETQVIPVKVSLDSYGEKLVPGMNVTARIHK